MIRVLSARRNVIINALWALGFVLGILVLARTVGVTLDDQPVLYGLLLLGPVLSAAFCKQLCAVLLGALGLGAGILLAGVLAAIFMKPMSVEWSHTIVLVVLISVADLVVSVPVWWCIRRLRRTMAVTTSAA